MTAQAEDGRELPAHIAQQLLEQIQTLVAELRPKRAAPTVGFDSRLDRDLGLDSLARVELLTRLERAFGVALPDSVYAEAETPRDLLRALQVAMTAQPAPLSAVEAFPGPRAEAGAPEAAATLVEVLDWHVRTHPEALHLQFYADSGAGETLNYRELHHRALAVAAGLHGLGIVPGQTVALMLPTGPDYFAAFVGTLYSGAIPVPLYPPARRAQLEEHLRRHRALLENCQAGVLIAPAEARALAGLLKGLTEWLRAVVSVETLASGATLPRPLPRQPGDVALLQYTSGSTGNPKGVVLTHANLLANIRAMGGVVHASAQDVFVSWLPLYHDMGLIGAWLGSLYYGIPLVLMSPLDFLARPQRWLLALHRYRGTLSAAPNFAYELCLNRLTDADLQGLDLSGWRVAFNGAEPVSAETVQRFATRFAAYGFRPETIKPVYGLAECSVGLSFPPLDHPLRIDAIGRDQLQREGRAVPARPGEAHPLRLVSCGHPLPGHEIRIVDEAGRELPEREVGRLQFRGPSATSGYYRNPEETRRLFDGDWLESGDLAYVAGSELYITGRRKDLIIHGGRNLYPAELEEAVGRLPEVRKGSVAAIGTSDPQTGTERLVILAETRATDPAGREQLQGAIRAAATDLLGLPPDDIVLLPPHTLLKTSSGKLRRAANRELYERGLLRGVTRPAAWQIAHLMLASLGPRLRRLRRSLAAWLYAGYCWALFGLLSSPTWIALALLPRPAWRWRVVQASAALLVRASRTRLALQGLEAFPRDGPCIVVANHASYLDPIALAAALPRRLVFVAKRELAERLRTRLPLARLGTVFVERFDRREGVAAARTATQAAQAGDCLVFFPEGTFTRSPGLLPFHLGAFLAAAEAEVPVVPVAIRGTRSMLRSGSWFPRRGAVSVSIGAPLHPQLLRARVGEDPWKVALGLRDGAREHILRHSGEPDLGQQELAKLS